MNSIPVFFSQKLVADAHSYSPSPKKPALAVASWKKLGIPITSHEPLPVSEEELCLAHDPSYVRKVLSCETKNGFGNKLPSVAASLPYTSGAFVAAAREAIRNGLVAVGPVSGFHHACYASGGGFCTFNGLAVAAQVLKHEGLVNKVGILDFDQHYGNGTADIIKQLNLQDWLLHYTAASEYNYPNQAEKFLKRIPDLVRRFADCDVILYQAGADPHIEDPLGGWLTTEQLAERDRLVFESAQSLGIPIAWNLAGGYQDEFRAVLDIHDNTLSACWGVFGEAHSTIEITEGV
jgi:acetoin utilization deacetylase AcuC-like enzyme